MLGELRAAAAREIDCTRDQNRLGDAPMPEPLVIHGRPTRSSAVALLEGEGLPVSDLTDRQLEHFFFTGPKDSPIGLVGLELHGSDALLRSLVVGAGARAAGLGCARFTFARQAPRS
jgi:hypothetical protein